MKRRLKAISTALLGNQNVPVWFLNGGYEIPKFLNIVNTTECIQIPIQKPHFYTKSQIISSQGSKPFVEVLQKYNIWLSKFVDEVLSSSDNTCTFCNSKLDFLNPGMSAFRLYDSNLDYLQVQVTRVQQNPEFFQLDIYYDDSNIPSLIVLCDIHHPRQTILDIVFRKNNHKETFSQATEVARHISSLFRALLIYLRPWDYTSKICTVFPFDSDCADFPKLPED